MLKLESSDLRGILIRLGVIAGIIILIYIAISLSMNSVNRSLGTDGNTDETSEDVELYLPPESFYTSGEGITLPEIEDLPEGPEASWEVTPCSIYVSESSEPVIDSLPIAPEIEDKPFEALFLVKRWAAEAGIEDEYIDQVYIFTKLDTIYVDLPSERDFLGLKLTIESRFICFTRLFPIVAGNLLSSYPEGIPLRGVEGVFRQ
ncbi:MAG: hypothetical protein KAR44_08435 [Candidatus Aegiribacteria sp.]|nr:hypothetical protein [Candidatus Aegiribacteria sp.]